MSDRRYSHKEKGPFDRRKDFQERVLFSWLCVEKLIH